MDTAQWPQDIMVRPMEGNTCPKPPSVERKVRPQKEQALNCPRCNSTNTKFCYYNNYSLSQPRYFCKTCRRYWTEGGTLRNIPVGGGTRKNKRSSSNIVSCKKLPDLVMTPTQNPKSIHEPQHLNLGFTNTPPDFKTISELIQVPNFENKDQLELMNPSSTSAALELLSNNTSRGLMSSFSTNIDPNNSVYSSSALGFSLPAEFSRPSLNFSLDGLGSNFGSFQETINGKLLFPFEDLKHNNNNNNDSENDAQEIISREQQGDSTGYWNGVLGGGGGGSW